MAVVVFDQTTQNGFVGFALAAAHGAVPGFDLALVELLLVWRHTLELDHGQVAALAEAVAGVPDISHAARHAGGKVAAGVAQHHHGAARHVFAAMITGAFDHGGGAGVAYGKALAR